MTLIAQFASVLPAVLPGDLEEFDADQVSPGVGGFVVVALMGVAVALLGLDLVRRLRRARYRAEIQEELAGELAAREAGAGEAGAGAPEVGEPDANEAPTATRSENDADPRAEAGGSGVR